MLAYFSRLATSQHFVYSMDSFAGLGFSGSKRTDKLSLAEQLKNAEQAKANARAQQANEWDSLFGGSSASASPAPSQQPATVGHTPPLASGGSKAQSSLLDEFDIFNSAKPVAPSQPANDKPSRVQVAEGSTGSGSTFDSKPRRPQQDFDSQMQPKREQVPRQPQREPQRQPPRQPSRDADSAEDAKIAQLVDMGFDAEVARKALRAMHGDVRGAVSYIMADAQGMPLPEPRRSTQDYDVSALATEFGTTVLAKASSMWSFGKKHIAKAVAEYQGGGSSRGSTDGSPAWMRDAEKYRNRAPSPQSTLPDSSSSSQSLPSSRKFTSDDAMPTRPSRAQAFREKRAALATNPGSPKVPASPSLASGASPSPVADSPSVPAAASVPNVDLLDLDGPPSAPPSTMDIFSASPTPSTSSKLSGNTSNHRENGLQAYKRGDYAEAVEHFDLVLSGLAANDILRSLIYSNRAACNLKSGNFREALNDTQQGLRLLPQGKLSGVEVEKGKTAQEIWSKLVLRQAEALEHAERYQEAGQAYQQLLDNGFASHTVLTGRRRCQKALDPELEAKAAPPPEKKSQRRKWNTTGEPTSAAGKAALQKVRDEHKRQANLEAERDGLRDVVTQRIDAWKTGKEDNLRALLSSLHTVLWADSGWQPVGLHDLVLTKKVRVVYMKAVARTHPDKVPSSASTEIKMIAQGVFVAINKAWDTFRTENGL